MIMDLASAGGSPFSMADLSFLIPDPKPAWLIRAMDPSTSSEGQSTVLTISGYSKDHGGELLVPTLRMGDEGLYEPKDPFQEALDRGDFILVPGPPGKATQDRATELSNYISNLIGRSREPQASFVDNPLYDRSQ
jgi:hypothetical protein